MRITKVDAYRNDLSRVIVYFEDRSFLTVDARRAEIMQMACKSAVKAGDALSDSEIRALIRGMMKTGAPPTCPHGRPVVKTLSLRDLEKMFKRIQ